MKSFTILLALLIPLGGLAQGWTELNGPFGGTISNFAFDDAGRSYCVTGIPVAGDVAALGSGSAFVSTDAGGHWLPLNLPVSGVKDLATKGSTLYVFASNQTTYISPDGGATWVTKGTIPGASSNQLYGIKALPMANGVIVYGMGGMYLSLDNGSTYTRLHAPFATGWRMPSVQVASNGDIFVGEYYEGLLKYPFPANPNVAGSWVESAWQNLIPTESVYQTDMDVAISPTDRIYVNMRTDANGSRFLSSIDYGATWQVMSKVGYTHTYNYSPRWAIAPNGRVFFIENAYGSGQVRTTYEFIEGTSTPWVKKAWPTSMITDQNVTVAAWRTNTQLFTGGIHDGVFISNNAAASFAPASTGIKLGRGNSVEVIPNGSGQRIVYTQGFLPNGYFYSDDDGQNWTLRSSPFPGLGIRELIKLPDNSLLVFAVPDKDSPGYTYRSIDGINWDKSSVAHEFFDFHVVAANDIYGFTNGEGIYESIDGGETWDLIPVNGIPVTGTILYGTRDADGFVYINMASSQGSEFWKIDTSVEPWQATLMTLPSEAGVTTSTYDLFVLNNKVYLNGSLNLVSSDHGTTWKTLPISGILIPVKQGDGALAVAADGKLSVTQDDGISFRNIDVATGFIQDISITSAGDFYAAGQLAPCLKYTDELILPVDQQPPFVPYDWKPVNGPWGGAVSKILNGPAGSFYALVRSTQLLKLPAGSTTWVGVGPAIVNDAFVDQSATLFTATTTGIQKSTDGTNFSQLYSGNTYAIVRLSTGELLASVNNGIVRSTDGGATFTPVSSMIATQLITSPNGTVLARINSEVYRSLNAGTTWTRCAENISGGVRNLGSLEGNVFSAGSSDTDTFRSADDGATWTSMKGNLPATSIIAPFALADGSYVINSNEDLYTSTNNGGSWTKRSNNMPGVTSAAVSGSTLLFATSKGIVQSADFGATFTLLNTGVAAQRMLSVKMFRGRLLAIGVESTTQLVQSDDLGINWSKVNDPVGAHGLLKVNDDLLIAYGFSGTYKTIDGTTWTKVTNVPLNIVATHDGSRYYGARPGVTGLTYVTSTDLTTWTEVPSTGLPATYNALVVGVNDTFYALSDYKLYRSSFGVNTAISFGNDVRVNVLTTQNGKVQVLWTNVVSGAQALVESVDGLTWTALPSTTGNDYIASELNHRFMLTSFVADTFIRVSRDGGVNWQNISSGSLSFDDIVVDEYTGIAFGFRSTPGPIYRTDKPILVDDKTGPLKVTISPGDDNLTVAIDSKIAITFNEATTSVSGKKLKVYIGTAVTPTFELDVTAGLQVNKTFTYSLPSALSYSTPYYVVIDNGAFKDLFGNLYTGITDQTSWSFTTSEAPDASAPDIATPTVGNLAVGTGNKEIQFSVTDNKTIDITSAKFFYSAVSSAAAPSAGTLSSTGTGGSVTFKATISESDYKAVGIAFYFEVADALGNKTRYPVTAGAFDYSYLTYPASQNPALPALAAGGKKGNYKMISLPFEFGSNKVSDLFVSLGPPAKDVWRLLTHAGGATTNWLEYENGDFSTIDRGVGYWINVKAPIEIKVPQASVPPNRPGNWFIMQLNPGWNQIGNPYTVPISWDEIRASNSSIGKVKVFNPGTLTYDNGDVMEKFGAGFVFLSGTATVPVTIRFQGFTTGRRPDPSFGTDLAADKWQLPITLSQGSSTSEFSGIGMHPDADNEMDRFDDLNPPAFLKLMEMNFEHPQGPVKRLAMDVVPTTEGHRWNFNVSTDTEEEVRLQWDNTQMGDNSKELFLFNESDQSLINMREQNIFDFKPVKGNRFSIYFGEDLSDKIKPTKVLAGDPYPNPSNGTTTIPFTLGDSQDHYNVRIDIVELLGRPVSRVIEGEYQPGFYKAVWDATDHNTTNGFYMFRLVVESNGVRVVQTGKIVVQK